MMLNSSSSSEENQSEVFLLSPGSEEASSFTFLLYFTCHVLFYKKNLQFKNTHRNLKDTFKMERKKTKN